MTAVEIVTLIASGMAAGAINAVAGGGTLITFPTLLLNTPPIIANATSTLSTKPNTHDFAELNSIYAHLDSTTTVAALTSPAASSSDVTDDPNSWGQLMSQSRDGRSSKYEKVNRDGSLTLTHVYWTLEAAAECPSCDHRYR